MRVVALLMGDMERSLHDYHKNERVEGEWFNLSEQIRNDYQSRYGVQELPFGKQSQEKIKLVWINDDLHHELKKLAVSSGIPLKDLTKKILSEYLKRKGGKK